MKLIKKPKCRLMKSIDLEASERDRETPVNLERHRNASYRNLSGTNLEKAGDYNQRVVLQAIRIHGPITRAELSRTTGLTAPAVANITRRLIQLGLVAEAGKRHGARGQPATKLVIHPDGCFALGVNIDRDHITVLILDLLGGVRARASQEGALAAPAAAAEVAAAMVRDLLTQPDLRRARLIGIGLALPDGLAQTRLPDRQPLHAWAEVDVAAVFAEALAEPAGTQLPVFVENDAAAAAQGELQFGLGLTYDSFFYVLVSAGLGGGLVVDGEYFRGANGRSGEIGFLPIHSDRTPGRSLQDAVSLSALFAHLTEQGINVTAPADLADLDVQGRDVVEAWVDLAADLLTEPLLAVSWLVNPAAILLGGRLPGALVERLAERLTGNLRRRAPLAPVLAPVRRAAMAEDAPAIGAALLPLLADLLPSRSSLMKV
jgi:predicted NBD/HSP70 family sugar kinase